MNEGCPGCFESRLGQQKELAKVRTKAIEFSKEQNESIAIYKDGNEYRFITAELAFEQQYNIIAVVSKYS